MNTKYELLRSGMAVAGGKTLYRIRALRDFGNVRKGDFGGFVESEANLSEIGNCWVSGDARVYGNEPVKSSKDLQSVIDDIVKSHGMSALLKAIAESKHLGT